MTILGGPVGIRNRTTQVDNLVADQIKIIDLLSQIDASDGGQRGWTPPAPGAPRRCPAALADAIRSFQEFWQRRGEFPVVDGVVDKGGRSLRKLDALAGGGGVPIGPNGLDPALIRLRQTMSDNYVAPHEVAQQVISPLSMGRMLQEIPVKATMRELLFEMRKDGAVFWVGAAVPAAATDFSTIQVFFHPTPVQNGVVIAADGDYPSFVGGWSGAIQRYTALQGGQLAAVRTTPLIVPFMSMAAFGGGSAYMFGSRPMETLNAIMTAVRDISLGETGAPPVAVTRLGVTSFSSGIGAMRLFIQSFGGSGIIAETTDLDSGHIRNSPRVLTRAPGAVARAFSQAGPARPEPGWLTLAADRFAEIRSYAPSVHSQIGYMAYFMACLGSTVL